MAFSIFQNMAKTKTGEGWMPPSNEIVKAGAFGAILGMATSGIGNYGRVKAGEIDTNTAVEETLSDGAKSAATMAVASVASHIVRAHPVAGFAALAAVGAGAFMVIKKASEQHLQEAAVHATSEEEVAEGPTIEVEVEEVVVEEPKPKRRRARRGQKAASTEE